MDFHEVRFPTDISLGSVGGPGFNTNIIDLDSGVSQAVSRWGGGGRRRYDVKYGIKTKQQIASLITFYIARQGPAIGFRYKDWLDYTSAPNHRSEPSPDDQNIGTGDGSLTQFQLVKKYASGGVTRVRNITKPVIGTIRIAFDGTEQTSGFTVNTTTGIVTFSTAPSIAVVITAGYEFDVPVHFGKEVDENLPITLETQDIGTLGSIPLVEIPDDNSINGEFYYGGAQSFTSNSDLQLAVNDGRVITVEPQSSGLKVILPDPTNLPEGGPYFYIQNIGNYSIDIVADDGSTKVVTMTTPENSIALSMATWGVVSTVINYRSFPAAVILGLDSGSNKTWYAI